MIAIDTSVAVAAFASWHERHRAAPRLLEREEARLIDQVALETYAVLTRLPPPHRAPAAVVVGFLDAFAPLLSLPGPQLRRLLRRLAFLGISGGAAYDARVAAAALDAGLPLATLDRRALPVYQAVGAQVRLLP